jgi:hypothetical protein
VRYSGIRFGRLALLLTAGLAGGCGNDDSVAPVTRGFLEGTESNPQIGLVVNSTGKALTLFQLGDPTETREIPFGASSAVTPVGLVFRGTHAVVPLGNAASAALVDLEGLRIDRFFTFPSGNATGAAFVDDNTFLVTNLIDNYVGKATLDQADPAITDTVSVAAPGPTAIVVAGGRAFVASSNLDETFTPLGPGIVTVIDPATMTPLDTIESGGTNSSAAAVGPDGLVYVVNTGDFVADGTLTVIDPATLEVIATYAGFGPGPGAIEIDADGLAYVSGFFTGTVVWDTKTHTFVRDATNPVCARLATRPGTPCRGAFGAARASDGSIYQAFFGSASESLPPYVFVYSPTYELVDSITVGVGPASIDIGTFTQ